MVIRLNYIRKIQILRMSFIIVSILILLFCKYSFGVDRSEHQKLLPARVSSNHLPTSISDRNNSNIKMFAAKSRKRKYDLDNPDEKYILPKYLTEISGLAFYKDNRILCIQDEKAIIYVFNLESKEVTDKYQFGQKGDYEDIAVIDQTAYVIRSDGEIFRVKNFNQNNRKVTELKTPLSRRNNTEGIAYDKLSNSLFIACKGSSEVKKNGTYEEDRAVYQFDLATRKLLKEPVLLIDLQNLYSTRDDNNSIEKTKSDAGKFRQFKRDSVFKPSGISINPISGQIYLISHIGEKLIITDRKGKIQDLYDLNNKIFRQPEGICFSPSGDLFISSEGDGGRGYILRFNMNKEK
jgi:uncharacterized protein YjiK